MMQLINVEIVGGNTATTTANYAGQHTGSNAIIVAITDIFAKYCLSKSKPADTRKQQVNEMYPKNVITSKHQRMTRVASLHFSCLIDKCSHKLQFK